ncbi:hypothetical protein NIES2101_23205 [Calothrix sp. HK-06]|nr:hypothetical protein NIES2101_23205 [Calothrix sp. HK-06]
MKNYTEVKYFNPNNLFLHTGLLRIYGDSEITHDMHLDIEKNGIMVPIVVSTRTPIFTIVSGGRRRQIAIALGIELVPVICYSFPTEEAEKHFILSANRDRPKTKYQKLLEGRAWELLEKQAAAARRQSGLKERWKNKDAEKSNIDDDEHDYYPVVLLDDYRLGTRVPNQSKSGSKTVDKVGERIGISGKSYQRAKPIIEKCEKLRSEGRNIEALSLEVYLESVGINPVAKLLKAPNCDDVLDKVGNGTAKTIKEAILMANCVQRVSAVVEGAIFFFPDHMLRKSTYVHLGRVVKIANTIATVVFRDKRDGYLYEQQYKCDELLTLEKEGETHSQIRLRDRMNKLFAHEKVTQVEQTVLNLLLGAVVSTPNEIDWLQLIEWRVAGEIKQG